MESDTFFIESKIESYNPFGSFKGRGVSWWFKQNPQIKNIVCASAGNFGQAVAYVGRKSNTDVTIFAAESANESKVAAMICFGAKMIISGHDFDSAKLAAEQYAQQSWLNWGNICSRSINFMCQLEMDR